MKVYIVLENNWQDYEGGGAEVVSVHGSRKTAFMKMKAKLPPGKRRRAFEDSDEWPISDDGASHYWFTIEEHEVEE